MKKISSVILTFMFLLQLGEFSLTSVNAAETYSISVSTDETSVEAYLYNQYQITKSDGYTVTDGGNIVKYIKQNIDNTNWYRLKDLYKTTNADSPEESYPGYKTFKAKLFSYG